jgi:hypothetical protein
MKRSAKAKTKTKSKVNKGTRKIRGGDKKDVLPSVAKIIKHHPKIGLKNAKIQNAIITIHAFDPDTQGGKVQIKPETMKQLRSALQYIQTHAPDGDLTRMFVDLVSDELPSKFEILSPSQSSLLDPADKAAAALEDAKTTVKKGNSPDGYASPGDKQNPLRSRSRSRSNRA